MIKIPLINKEIKADETMSPSLQVLVKEIEEMSQTKEWKDFISNYGKKPKNGGGRSKK